MKIGRTYAPCGLALLTLVFSLIVPCTAFSQESVGGRWYRFYPQSFPAGRTNHDIIAAEGDAILLFGGKHDTDSFNDSWIFKTGSRMWQKTGTGSVPIALSEYAIVNSGDQILMHGGKFSSFTMDALYRFKTGTWEEVSFPKDAVKPPALSGHKMIYDGAGTVILFGGRGNSGYSNQTWAFDVKKSAWIQLNPTGSPSARAYFDMAYCGGNTVVLFGGWDGQKHLNEAWIYDIKATAWQKVETAADPEPRSYMQLEYLGKEKVVMFGGNTREKLFGDTFVLDLKTWSWQKLSPKTGPSARTMHAMTAIAGGSVVLFGGNKGFAEDLNDVWLFNPQDYEWSLLFEAPAPPFMTGCDLIRENDWLYLAWGYADPLGYPQLGWKMHIPTGKWEKIKPVEKNKRTAKRTGQAWVSRGMMTGACSALAIGRKQILCLGELDETGGGPGQDFFDSLAVYNMADNTLAFKYCSKGPLYKSGYSLVFDGSNAVYMFGGSYFDYKKKESNLYNDLWIYSISANKWEEIRQINPPSPREGQSMVYTGKGTIVLFGGRDNEGGLLHDLWEYEIAKKTWREITPTENPESRMDHRMVGIGSQNLLLFGGTNGQDKDLSDAWLYDINSRKWKKIAPPVSPLGRSKCGMAYLGDNKIFVYGLSNYKKSASTGNYSAGEDSRDFWILDLNKVE